MSNAHNKDGKYRGIIDEIREQLRQMCIMQVSGGCAAIICMALKYYKQ